LAYRPRIVAWVAALKGSQPVTGKSEPYMGFSAGRLFDPGPQRMSYRTRQGKPWFNVDGPGVHVMQQLAVAEPASIQSQVLQVFPVQGQGGQPAGTYPSQGLSLPPSSSSSIGQASSASI
jgi:hypothetical protein